MSELTTPSIQIEGGYFGSVGSNSQQVIDAASNPFSSWGITSVRFQQEDTDGEGRFTAQGNDIPGVLIFTLWDGSEVRVEGQITWVHKDKGTIELYGFVVTKDATITNEAGVKLELYAQVGTGNDITTPPSNIALDIFNSEFTSDQFVDGDRDGNKDDIRGSADINGALSSLNEQLDNQAVITLDAIDVDESQTYFYTASVDKSSNTAFSITLSNGAIINFAAGSTTGTSELQLADEDVYLDAISEVITITGITGSSYYWADLSSTATVTIDDTIDPTTVTLLASTDTFNAGEEITIIADLGANAAQSEIVLTLSNGGSITIQAGETSGETSFIVEDSTVITITSIRGDGNFELLDFASASIEIEVNAAAFQGLSHGYWRNHGPNAPGRQANDWDVVTGSDGSDYDGKGGSSFENLIWGNQVADITWSSTTGTGRNRVTTQKDDITMMEALSLGGGGKNALAREAVAAILNARDEKVNYFWSETQITGAVKSAWAGGSEYSISALHTLLEANNTLGLEPVLG
jgi:hypothetical protein